LADCTIRAFQSFGINGGGAGLIFYFSVIEVIISAKTHIAHTTYDFKEILALSTVLN